MIAYEYSVNFNIVKEKTIDNNEINITTKGGSDILILEVNKQGNIINHCTLGDKSTDIPRSIHSVSERIGLQIQ